MLSRSESVVILVLSIPSIELNSGRAIPQVGLGVFKIEPKQTEKLVSEALEAGYRHIDTAMIYKNEKAVGRAIAASGVPRDELFITTKLWNSDHEHPRKALKTSLERLGLDKVDLYLIHWPMPMHDTSVGAWRSLVKFLGEGTVASIGVSNFEIEHLRHLVDETGVVPAVNQIELHPLHQRTELRDYCHDLGIAIEAWGPLTQGKSNLLQMPEVTDAAELLGKTPAQVVLRWHVQLGNIVIPKTARSARLVENADLFDFRLSDAQMTALNALDSGQRFGPDPHTFDAK